jgi:hypothetical protein
MEQDKTDDHVAPDALVLGERPYRCRCNHLAAHGAHPLMSPTRAGRTTLHVRFQRSAARPRFRSNAARASIARWLAWPEASGRPPSFSNNSSLLTAAASFRVFPKINSVRADPQAMAGTHPWARNFTSAIRPEVSLAVSLRTSPQAGFSTCTPVSGESTTPALRGCSK